MDKSKLDEGGDECSQFQMLKQNASNWFQVIIFKYQSELFPTKWTHCWTNTIAWHMFVSKDQMFGTKNKFGWTTQGLSKHIIQVYSKEISCQNWETVVWGCPHVLTTPFLTAVHFRNLTGFVAMERRHWLVSLSKLGTHPAPIWSHQLGVDSKRKSSSEVTEGLTTYLPNKKDLVQQKLD